MTVTMDKCTVRVRVRDTCGDDVIATTIKEKKRKNNSSINGDVLMENYLKT